MPIFVVTRRPRLQSVSRESARSRQSASFCRRLGQGICNPLRAMMLLCRLRNYIGFCLLRLLESAAALIGAWMLDPPRGLRGRLNLLFILGMGEIYRVAGRINQLLFSHHTRTSRAAEMLVEEGPRGTSTRWASLERGKHSGSAASSPKLETGSSSARELTSVLPDPSERVCRMSASELCKAAKELEFGIAPSSFISDSELLLEV
ncbi:hypothetical protein Nepgr_012443 [Nepenthes gracilis]|uniref:Uncharacterized protein n=1 Tax=Nepenthes gracilis TaxID=150966 RepID=A0AAD3XMT3_NEPGR|nr:hypothetical protein Nepgr_012443 [Nepenthes gracilis]